MTTSRWNRVNPEFDAALTACDFGSLIRTLRESTKISQEQLGSRLDCFQSTVARWEDRRNVPTVRTLAAIAAEVPATLTISFASPFGSCSATFDGVAYKHRRDRHRLGAILLRRANELLET